MICHPVSASSREKPGLGPCIPSARPRTQSPVLHAARDVNRGAERTSVQLEFWNNAEWAVSLNAAIVIWNVLC